MRSLVSLSKNNDESGPNEALSNPAPSLFGGSAQRHHEALDLVRVQLR